MRCLLFTAVLPGVARELPSAATDSFSTAGEPIALEIRRSQPPVYRNPEHLRRYMDDAMTFAHSDWSREGSPVGNGRLGAMVFGDPLNERIHFNELSLWTGGAEDYPGYDFEPFGSYQSFGDLFIEMDGEGEVEDDSRVLDLSTATHRTRWTRDGVKFQREVFASHPDEVIVVRITADQPGKVAGTVRLQGAHGETSFTKGNRIRFRGKFSNDLRYAASVTVLNEGGEIKSRDGRLSFTGNAATLILAAATDYALDPSRNFRNGIDPLVAIASQTEAVVGQDPGALRERHLRDFQSLMGRVELDLGAAPAGLSIDERLDAYRAGAEDPHLEMLLFQFGRYLLISSSRDFLPANLQGVWNEMNDPAWCCDYHTNINLQMNYWPAEPANLAECAKPLFDWIEACIPTNRAATRKAFGDETPGWTMRTMVNAFGGAMATWNLPASAWFARHYWDHYAFTQDREFLARTAWPVLEEVSGFWLGHLVERDGKLVVPNDWSPEHGPREDGVAHGQQLVWDLFTNTLEAAAVLGIDTAFVGRVREARDRLHGPQIGSWGQLMEWMTERPQLEKSGHRHTSHLFAVYPGRQISATGTPQWAEAAKVSLTARGTSGNSRRSWTWPWRCALWSRLGEPERAGGMIRGLVTHNLLPNLLATHPPFQVDGNLGMTAAICEMLVQSHAGEISLLPAVPVKWKRGSFAGLRARGGFEVGASWDEGGITGASIHSLSGGPVSLRLPVETDQVHCIDEAGGTRVTVSPDPGGVFRFSTRAGSRYRVEW
ncbi:glycosyl hydrolase family 95 catalytic domain-containing protein [Haloferula sp. A504]|uniref:glycoside hydrolase family 95 protein n=1 Tax=Haloferula sp. A504 TaxID=3373601 RepID=UPI0031C4D77F|nr:glycoside hydrolase N-terminal domain-containing protein [Verrucomicrobiaceae bacterium E54]